MNALGRRSLLDAALIVKDEAHHLPECLSALLSMRPLLGEIYVYDTGSTDESVAICESHGCIVERGHWDDDFARARNAASAMSSAVWLLHVDADEVAQADVGRLGRLLAEVRDAVNVIYFTVRSWDEGRLLGDAPIGRMLRRDSVVFTGRVHEHATPKEAGGEAQSVVLPSDILLMSHVGYSGRGTLARKSERNAAISDAEVKRCRQSGIPEGELQLALIHRARANSALEKWDLVEQDLREVRSMESRLATRMYAGQLLVDRAISMGDLECAADLLEEVAAEGSDPQWTRWKLASIAHEQGNLEMGWNLMRGVDHVVGGLGESVAPAAILYDRAKLAIAAGQNDEAVASALVLVGTHGYVEMLDFLLAAFSNWPASGLAQLLADQGTAFAARIGEALGALGPSGLEVAKAYMGLLSERIGSSARRWEPATVGSLNLR